MLGDDLVKPYEELTHRGQMRRMQRLTQAVLVVAPAFAEQPQGWLVLVGSNGGGKNHLAAAIAKRCIERGKSALFVAVPDLLDHLRAAVGFDALFEQVKQVPVLILDDWGAQSGSDWAWEKLCQFLCIAVTGSCRW
jgi:DNA replication protein DnaC